MLAAAYMYCPPSKGLGSCIEDTLGSQSALAHTPKV